MYNLGSRLDAAVKAGRLDNGLISELNSLCSSLNALQGWLPRGGSSPYFSGKAETHFSENDHLAIKLHAATAQTIGSTFATALTFSTKELPSGLGVGWNIDLTSEISSITIPETGIYWANIAAQFDLAADGQVQLYVYGDNDLDYYAKVGFVSLKTGTNYLSTSDLFYWPVGTVVIAIFQHFTGVDADVQADRKLSIFKLRGVQNN